MSTEAITPREGNSERYDAVLRISEALCASWLRSNVKLSKKTCQKHCFSTLNHNLAYCYNDARVIKWMWDNVKRGFRGGMRSFED
jgi:hypothetical protein